MVNILEIEKEIAHLNIQKLNVDRAITSYYYSSPPRPEDVHENLQKELADINKKIKSAEDELLEEESGVLRSWLADG